MKRIWVVVCMSIVVSAFVGGDEGEAERLLFRYVQPGVVLSEKRYKAEYLSEKEAVVAALEQFLIWQKKDEEFKEVKFGKPIVVRNYRYHSPHPYGYDYYDCVPLVDALVGVRGAYYCSKFYNAKTGKNFYEAGLYSPMGQKGKPMALLYGEDVKRFIEGKYGVKVKREPMAVRLIVRRLKLQEQDWFWYVRIEEGIEYEGRRVQSLFVSPYVSVPEVGAELTVELLMDRRSCMAIHVLVKDRVYTYEGEDIDFYELERKREHGEQVNTGDAREEYRYMEEIRFIPLR